MKWQFIDITTDNLNITANVPNSFIHSGAGEDAIDVSKANGTNVLDGGTSSNFLVGGSGTDTFFVDDRNPSADIWSKLPCRRCRHGVGRNGSGFLAKLGG